MGKLVVKVPTLHCRACLETIERALKERQGIARVDGDLWSKQVTVVYRDDEIAGDDIRAAIIELGHVIA